MMATSRCPGVRPCCASSRASTSRSASAAFRQVGLSHTRCLPLRSTVVAWSRCRYGGLTTDTRSTCVLTGGWWAMAPTHGRLLGTHHVALAHLLYRGEGQRDVMLLGQASRLAGVARVDGHHLDARLPESRELSLEAPTRAHDPYPQRRLIRGSTKLALADDARGPCHLDSMRVGPAGRDGSSKPLPQGWRARAIALRRWSQAGPGQDMRAVGKLEIGGLFPPTAYHPQPLGHFYNIRMKSATAEQLA